MRSQQSANCPDPPVCFLCRPWACAVLRIGLAIGDAQLGELGLDVEAVVEPRDHDVDGGVAHRGEHRLVRLLVAPQHQARVLVHDALEGGAELVLVRLGLGDDRDRVERLGQGQRAELDAALGRQRVVREDVAELGEHGDVAGGRAIDVGGLLAGHLEDVGDALLLAGAGVHELGAGRQRAGDDLHEVDATDVGVAHAS